MIESNAKPLYIIGVACLRIIFFYLIINATLTLLFNHKNGWGECFDTGAFINIWTWAYVLAGVDTIYLITIMLCVFIAVTTHVQDMYEVATTAVQIMLCNALVNKIFCLFWVIIIIPMIIFRNNDYCILEATPIFMLCLFHFDIACGPHLFEVPS